MEMIYDYATREWKEYDDADEKQEYMDYLKKELERIIR